MKQLLAFLLLLTTHSSFAQELINVKTKRANDSSAQIIQNGSNSVFKTTTLTPCRGGDVTLSAGISGSSYQWQVDAGSGFGNFANGGIYSGATTATLQISGAPTSLYGYQYRCNVNGNFSTVYILKFISTWIGGFGDTWENQYNWNCNLVPDANTDIVINSGSPVLNSIQTVRTFSAGFGVNVTIRSGAILTISK